jgi:hypothetical protein
MTKKEDVTLREYFDEKFNVVDEKLTSLNGFVKDYYERSCKRFDKLEDFREKQEKINRQISFARWTQKNWKTAIFLMALFVIIVSGLNLNALLQIFKLI